MFWNKWCNATSWIFLTMYTYILLIIDMLCKWVKALIALGRSDAEFTIAGLVSILALVVRSSTYIRFRNRRLELSHWRHSLVVQRMNDDTTVVLRYYYAIAKSVSQRRNHRRFPRWPRLIESLTSIRARIARIQAVISNNYDNHGCYFHALRSANWLSGL